MVRVRYSLMFCKRAINRTALSNDTPGISGEPITPSQVASPQDRGAGHFAARGLTPRRDRLGLDGIGAEDRRAELEFRGWDPPPARRVCRLAVPERATGGRVRRRRGLHPLPRRDRRGLPRPPDGPIAGPGRGAPRTGRRPAPPRGLPFESQGVRYTSSIATDACSTGRAGSDADGETLAEVEAEVRYALGSGTRGITYLIERDGFLFQSPIAWFAQQRPMGNLTGLRRGPTQRTELRARDPARVPVLPHEPGPSRGRDVEPLRAAASSTATPSGASAATARASCTWTGVGARPGPT